MENKVKHLEMIQGIINRMASNSFMLKGWSITLIAGIFALSSKESEKLFFLITYIPVIVFWLLDTYYLQLERKYRKLYNKVCRTEEKSIDFSMKITNDILDKKTKYINCLFSVSEMMFYIPTTLLISGIMFLVIK